MCIYFFFQLAIINQGFAMSRSKFYFDTLTQSKTTVFSRFKRAAGIMAMSGCIGLTGCIKPTYNNSQPFEHLSSSRYQSIANKMSKSGVDIFKQGRSIRMILPGKILFIPGTTRISPKANSILDLISELVQHAPNVKIQVLGYTDNVLTYQHRQIKSQQMANTVAAHLWHRGALRSQMRIQGMGDRYPISGSQTAAGNVSNQRVEVLIN